MENSRRDLFVFHNRSVSTGTFNGGERYGTGRRPLVFNVAPSSSSANGSVTLNKPEERPQSQKLKKSQYANVRNLTGTVERVLKWHKMNSDTFCYYELIASIIGLKEGSVARQKIMLMRNKNRGPVMQVVYYDTDFIQIRNFYIGATLRCIGHMVAPSTLRAFKIREAMQEEVDTLMRMYYISEHALMEGLKQKENEPDKKKN